VRLLLSERERGGEEGEEEEDDEEDDCGGAIKGGHGSDCEMVTCWEMGDGRACA
jgi:hypothetical protein